MARRRAVRVRGRRVVGLRRQPTKEETSSLCVRACVAHPTSLNGKCTGASRGRAELMAIGFQGDVGEVRDRGDLARPGPRAHTESSQ